MDESQVLSPDKENLAPFLSSLSDDFRSNAKTFSSPARSRRSQWFSPCNSPRRKPNTPDELPKLHLTHFAQTPRVGFGSVRIGNSKTEELVVWNPNSESQTLRIEKLPSEKGFSLDFAGFIQDEGGNNVLIVEPEEEVLLPITWEPKEGGRCRELFVFKWAETHRLLAIVYGTAIEVVKKTAKKKKPSVLTSSQSLNKSRARWSTTKAKQPFSVVVKESKPIPHPVTPLLPPGLVSIQKSLEFGNGSIPATPEEARQIDLNSEERRETYVVGTPRRETMPVAPKVISDCIPLKPAIDDDPVEDNADTPDVAEESKPLPSAEDGECVTQKVCVHLDPRSKHPDPSLNVNKDSEEGKTQAQTTDEIIAQLISDHKKKKNARSHSLGAQRNIPNAKEPKKEAKRPARRQSEVKPRAEATKAVLQPVAFSVQPQKREKPKALKRNSPKHSSARGSASGRKTHKVKVKVASKGVAPTRLKLVKPPRTSIPQHPMPYAAKNMYYDERWIDKQEEGFTRWLNFILTPPDDCDVQLQKDKKGDCGTMSLTGTQSIKSSQPLAPTKEDLSFRTYTARRRMQRLRRHACLLYQSEPLIPVIRKIESEVEHGRLAIRSDRKLHADLGIKQTVVNMILSYNTLWLRIGLETIFGEILPIQSNNDVAGIARFLSDRLLGNPSIARAFAHPTVPGLYRDGYITQLSKFTLKKFLLLVLFLDHAKLTRLIDHDPCLFNRDAEFKASRDLLLTFSRDYLKGEGDLTKHLSYLGFNVSHQQRAIDEFDYAVTNIATDLRDGLRLTRVVELLSHNWRLTSTLRVPAISRLQKIHNVEVVLKALKDHGVPVGEGEGSGITPRHIVDGHREKTLNLLWMIIVNFQVNILLSEEKLKEEISFLEQSLDLEHCLAACDVSRIMGLPRNKRDSLESGLYFKSARLGLLLKWCRLVCKSYGLKIDNFTVSFSDGRALCYLLHHYHPALLPLSAIRQETTLTRNPGVLDSSDSEEDEGILRDSWTESYSPGSGKNHELERLKANERENFKLLAEKVQTLGGVPLMTKFADMSNTIPDEKVVITYTSYLCARLLDLRDEKRAARRIQVAWRRHKLRKQLQRRQDLVKSAVLIQALTRGALHQRRYQALRKATLLLQSVYRGHLVRQRMRTRDLAAQRIQSHFRANRSMLKARAHYQRLRQSAIALQSIVRGNKARRQVREIRAARVIQASWRGYIVMSRVKAMKIAVVTCQSAIRGFLARKRLGKAKKAAAIIQQGYRASVKVRKARSDFLALRNATVKMQALHRGNQDRKFVKKTLAAITIQSFLRMKLCRDEYLRKRESAIRIQAEVRRYLTRGAFLDQKRAVLIMQTRYLALKNGRERRQELALLRASTIRIQACFRRYTARRKFLVQRAAVVRIQACFKGHIARGEFERLRSATVLLQSFFRGHLMVKKAIVEYQALRSAAVVIQSWYKAHICRKRFILLRKAAVTIQAAFRSHVLRKRFLALQRAVHTIEERYTAVLHGRLVHCLYHLTRGAIITLQAAIRGYLARKEIAQQRHAAVIIQTAVRGYMRKKDYMKMKHATTAIQRRYRAVVLGRLATKEYRNTREAVITMQATFRGERVRKELRHQANASVLIQALFRGYIQRANYTKLKKAARVIQPRYRAYLAGRAAREEYAQIRAAVITIQAFYRGAKVRDEVRVMNASAVRIQAIYRGFTQRRQYYSLRRATHVFQSQYRALVKGRREAERYMVTRKAVLTVQAFLRGMVARKEVKCLRAAVRIQACYRGYTARKEYSRCVTSIVLMQALVRRNLAVKRYQALREAAIGIQKRFRAKEEGKLVYLMFHIQRGACIVIQSAVRALLARKRFLEMKTATLILQKRYRALNHGRRERAEYHRARAAVITIQAYIRGTQARDLARRHRAARAIQSSYKMHRARVSFVKSRACVVKIQAWMRMKIQRTRFIALREATCMLQTRYRAIIAGRTQRFAYCYTRCAVIAIQATIRGFLTRSLLSRQHNAATAIQTAFRGYKARQSYNQIRTAVLVLQTRWRSCLLARAVARNYCTLRLAAIVMQSHYRGQVARRFVRRIRAAVLIQAAYRSSTARRQYTSLRDSVVVIQRNVRRCQAQRSYRRLRCAVIFVQRTYRALQQLQKDHVRFLVVKYSAIAIQSAVRGWMCKRRYDSLRQATLLMQQRRRANVLGRIKRGEFVRNRQASVVVQSAYRAWVARKVARRMRAARLIQSYYRSCVARKAYLRYRSACVRMQALVRGKQAREAFMELKMATVTLQRRYKANAACKNQREYYSQLRRSVIQMQSLYIGRKARKIVRQMVEERKARSSAAVKIQQVYRGYKLTQIHVLNFHFIRGAIITLQAAYRGYSARKHLQKLRAVIKIQAYLRGATARRNYETLRRAVITMQARARGNLAQRKYTLLKSSTSVIQTRFRAQLAMRKARENYTETRAAAITLQSTWRGHQQRLQYSEICKSAVVLQSHVRAYQARRRFVVMKQAAAVIQTRYHAYRDGASCRLKYNMLRRASVTIQSFYRGYLSRQHVRQIKAAVTLQKHARALLQGRKEHRDYITMKRAAVVLQSAYRGRCARLGARSHRAARIIQSLYRGFVARKRVERMREVRRQCLLRFSAAVFHHLSAIRVQRFYRRARALAVARKEIASVVAIQFWWRGALARHRYLRMRSAAIVLQQAARRSLDVKHRAATRIQALARAWLAKKAMTTMNSAALKIQALWRGYQVRRHVTSLKVKKARKRIEAANEAATESMKLCNRTRSALDYLLTCKNLSSIYKTLVNLEVVTRLSYVCCEQLLRENALRVIFTVIRNSNRSLPQMEIVKYALAILINVAKCPSTFRAVYEEPDSLSTLVELMTIFREKDVLFSKACCLITVLGRRDHSIVQDIINQPKICEKFRSISSLVERKYKREARRSVVKSKMTHGTPYKAVPPSTPCQNPPPSTPYKKAPLVTPYKHTPFKTPYKAKRQSDWAMWQEYVNKIQDPLHAVRSMMRTYHLDDQ
ncbi:abnormal spindle-like microcephaly-associated protein homolog [Nematostella vectensis]|uniref:abnormal spindle-like microcephaly-associated protein homolog n=1 Tax=Nematostella vectensis TaxID=45351 RepID=UPI0020778385|nr:abnormal spindle-like microcephaly-associated protein homolog [Nematostella vectensis]